MTDSLEPYNSSQFDPPAPVARVTLRDAHGGAAVPNVLLLLDTGADVTLLPRSAVERLSVPVLTDEPYELAGFDGARRLLPSASLDVVFLRRAFRGRYVLTDDAHGILGRDVLNHAALLLDGPRQQWSQQFP